MNMRKQIKITFGIDREINRGMNMVSKKTTPATQLVEKSLLSQSETILSEKDILAVEDFMLDNILPSISTISTQSSTASLIQKPASLEQAENQYNSANSYFIESAATQKRMEAKAEKGKENYDNSLISFEEQIKLSEKHVAPATWTEFLIKIGGFPLDLSHYIFGNKPGAYDFKSILEGVDKTVTEANRQLEIAKTNLNDTINKISGELAVKSDISTIANAIDMHLSKIDLSDADKQKYTSYQVDLLNKIEAVNVWYDLIQQGKEVHEQFDLYLKAINNLVEANSDLAHAYNDLVQATANLEVEQAKFEVSVEEQQIKPAQTEEDITQIDEQSASWLHKIISWFTGNKNQTEEQKKTHHDNVKSDENDSLSDINAETAEGESNTTLVLQSNELDTLQQQLDQASVDHTLI